jgi:hypothetical protein
MQRIPLARTGAAWKIGSMSVAQPTTVDALIDEFVRQHRYLPEEAVAVADSDELPLRLQTLVRSVPLDGAWRAWADGFRVWFVIARCVSDPRAAIRETVVEMSFCDQDGVCAATAAWLRLPNGAWRLHRLPADTADDESGDSAETAAANDRASLNETSLAAIYRSLIVNS